MPEGLNSPKPLNEHLNPGIKPIMTCIDDGTYFRDRLGSVVTDPYANLGTIHHQVDYFDDVSHIKEANFLNGGEETYVISVIDDLDKFSRDFVDCTGLVVAGTDKQTGQNISFITHQDPLRFLHDVRDTFTKDLEKQLSEMQARCVPGTIDVVVVGGNYNKAVRSYRKTTYAQSYLDSIKFLGEKVKKVLGFEPPVINGPKLVRGRDDIMYDNKERRIYLLRAKINADGKDFLPSDIDTEKGKWN